ncbi:Alpha-ketoglutarate-dependent dioxygenase alkB 6 [Phlyctochytrium bullatum]|nr:Alpha-ketoglutarate-dependent dioxygenase alkB 6 [Phlyctochytrium bullatum]
MATSHQQLEALRLDLSPFRIHAPPAPPTVLYLPNFLTHAQEQRLLSYVNTAPLPKWTPLRTRRSQHWGCTPTGDRGTALHDTLPPWLQELGDRIAGLGVFRADLCEPLLNDGERKLGAGVPNHVLVNEYKPGQGIMPHGDGPAYSPVVATVSLGQHTVLRLHPCRTSEDDGNASPNHDPTQPCSFVLQPRSLFVIADEAYTAHLHGIEEVSVDELRRDAVLNWTEAGLPPDRERVSLTRDSTRVSLTFRRAKRVARANVLAGLHRKK